MKTFSVVDHLSREHKNIMEHNDAEKIHRKRFSYIYGHFIIFDVNLIVTYGITSRRFSLLFTPWKIVYCNYASSVLQHCPFIVDHLMSIALLVVIDLLSEIACD